jgi:hypothetical protein
MRAERVKPGTIEVDGELNEASWQMASPATDFIQFEPVSGKQSTEKTEVRVLYDEFNLYIGAILYDSDPDAIIADEMRRDSDIERNDNFLVIIDPYHDHRNGFFFQTNPLGAQSEKLVFDEGKYLNTDWDGLWWVEAKKTSGGWQVEMRIPFSTLRFEEKRIDKWGLQFGRFIRRKNEHVYWSYIPYDASQWRLSLAGHLTGLKEIKNRKNLEVKTYALVKSIEERDISTGEKDTDISGDVGLDIKYFITPNLIADLTVNPDFAQVEADELKIKVTRFPLFFPEKREFFLERSGYFEFGIDGRIQPFFSRRIGIASGNEIPILAGGKLSGKIKKYNIGLLSIQTDDMSGEPQTNYTVLRLKREILDRSSVGLIAINKEPDKDNYNRTFGADLYLPVFDHLYIDSFLMKTKTEHTSDNDTASYVSVAWRDPIKYISLSYLDVDDQFNPEVGFVKRTGIKENMAYGEVFIRPLESVVRRYSLSSTLVYITDQQNRKLDRDINLGFTVTLHSGDYFDISYLDKFEHLESDFEIRPGIVIPEGNYSNDTLSLSASTDDSRKISGYVLTAFGKYFDGDRNTYSVSLLFKPSKHFKVIPAYTREDVDLPAGSFDADLVTATIEYTISTKTFINALLQWNDDLKEFSTNLRFNYEYSPGSDIYLVYNATRDTNGDGLKERAVFFKITRLW